MSFSKTSDTNHNIKNSDPGQQTKSYFSIHSDVVQLRVSYLCTYADFILPTGMLEFVSSTT